MGVLWDPQWALPVPKLSFLTGGMTHGPLWAPEPSVILSNWQHLCPLSSSLGRNSLNGDKCLTIFINTLPVSRSKWEDSTCSATRERLS